MTKKAFVLIALLSGCKAKPAVDLLELEHMRAEQKALRARIETLQAEVDAQRAAPPASTVAPRIAPPSPGVPPSPTALAAPSARAAAPAAPSQAAASPTGLRTEDLHGAPVAGGLATPDKGAVPDEEAAKMLEQLHGQLEQLKKNQADQQSALDALEQLK